MTLCSSLDAVRQRIDRVDQDVVTLLVERSYYVRQAAHFKKTKAEIFVPERVEEIIAKACRQTDTLGGDPDLVEKIYRSMIDAYIWYEARIWHALHGTE